jgi:hypothetical protein
MALATGEYEYYDSDILGKYEFSSSITYQGNLNIAVTVASGSVNVMIAVAEAT